MRELAVALPRALAAFPARIASRPVRLTITPRMRLRLTAAAAAIVALASLYQFWFRDSSLVAVEHVQVTGLTTRDARSISAALESAAEGMTTLHIRKEALDEVARNFPAIASLRVEPDFPDGLRIAITERIAAAIVEIGGSPLPVAADGTVLHGARPPTGLPVLQAEKPQKGARVTDERALRALLVLGAAPDGLPQRIEGVTEESQRGIVIELDEGPEILFGDADRAHEKWAAATRVLADPQSGGASYIDVRLPERPVAGGLPVETIEPVAPAGEPIPVPPATALDPATGAPIEPATGTPVDPATGTPVPATGTPADPAAPPAEPAPAAPQTAAPGGQAPAEPAPTGGVTSP